MSQNELIAEIETDALDVDDLVEIGGAHDTCNGFAFAYAEEHENAIVKDAFVDSSNGGAHCFVYDRELDVTIDPMLGQFNGCPDVGAWEGDNHPYACDFEEIREWGSRTEFEAHYGALPEADNPFYL